MDYTHHNTSNRRNKHLNHFERGKIEAWLEEGSTPYAVAKKLGRATNTIYNEIKRGTTTQIKGGKAKTVYLADRGQAAYEDNRRASKKSFKRLECSCFIDYVTQEIQNNDQSVDSCIGQAKVKGLFEPSEMVCTKTFYTYMHLGLLDITPMDLPMVLRRSSKKKSVRQNKRILGESIENRPDEINERKSFGHWEIDTVIGRKTKDDAVLLTLTERLTRHDIVLRIGAKTAPAVEEAIQMLKEHFGSGFSQVFKSITSDNGQEFSSLPDIEALADTKVYYTHPYASFERGTNERHNGLIRRFIPKGKAISDYELEHIAFVEEWMNTLPRKILGYQTPEALFEAKLDQIYAA